MSQLSFTSGKNSFTPTYFVDVILPLPLHKLFTYRVPKSMEAEIAIGCRVVVPFGKSQILTAIIQKVHNDSPKEYVAKRIIDILEVSPSFNEVQLKFYHWIADYYLCTPGEVLQAGLPSGLKVNTTSLLQRNPYFDESDYVLSIEEQLLLHHLSVDTPIESLKIINLMGKKAYTKVLKALITKDAVLLIDHIKEKFSPKLKKCIRLEPSLISNEEALEEVFRQLEKRPKQIDVLMAYLREVPALEDLSANENGMLQEDLVKAGYSLSSINTLARNGIIEQFDKEVSRFKKNTKLIPPKKLSDKQNEANTEILTGFQSNKPVLLHGITGSGKTEIYIELILEVLASGHQVLYLLPEIALTTQIVARLEQVFGDNMGVYHSKYSANERVEVWQNLISGKINLVVGVRSSVFLPFDNLGLIIIDEEHDSSYKQYDPAPRYNARDAALMLAQMHKAKTLLGTATPSLESYQLAITNKYTLVTISERFGGSVLPQVSAIDISKALKKKKMRGNFSEELVQTIDNTLSKEEQVIIFQNRRGYAPLLSCKDCGWVPQCKHCDVSLTYHQYSSELRCHYCGYKTPSPSSCISCGSVAMQTVSFGTEQLEEELKHMFPETEIARLDLDTTKGRGSYARIIDNFGSGKIKILVGTQMVTKGLDFDNVGLVGIINLDRMLHFPDFRSVERTFQLAVQVAGRAGRKEKQGQVLIQTYNPDQEIVPVILNQDYKLFFEKEIIERKLFNYPPFSRMTKLVIKGRDHQVVSQAVNELYHITVKKMGSDMVLGPVIPSISRVRDKYLREIYLKIGRQMSISKVRQTIRACAREILIQKSYKTITIVIDVDPV
ncbi:MAG: primosomal protein N' [Bacteroidota bacterium]